MERMLLHDSFPKSERIHLILYVRAYFCEILYVRKHKIELLSLMNLNFIIGEIP